MSDERSPQQRLSKWQKKVRRRRMAAEVGQQRQTLREMLMLSMLNGDMPTLAEMKRADPNRSHPDLWAMKMRMETERFQKQMDRMYPKVALRSSAKGAVKGTPGP